MIFFCATRPEWKYLRKKITFKKSKSQYSMPVFEAVLPEDSRKKIRLVQTGIGPKKPEFFSSVLFAGHAEKPVMVVQFGLSGALDKNLKPGDIVLPDRFVNHHGEVTFPSPELFNTASLLIRKLGISFVTGALFTSQYMLKTQKEKEQEGIAKKAVAVDMETYPLAAFCHSNKIPFLSIRAVFDPLDWDLSLLADSSFIDERGDFCARKFAVQIFVKPKLLTDLPRYKSSASVGGRKLAALLRHFFKGTSDNVIPAKAGIQNLLKTLDSHFRGNDKSMVFRGTLNSLIKSVYRFVDHYAKSYQRLNIARNAASLSFFTIVSVFPLCFVLVNVMSYFVSYEKMVGEILIFIENFLPYQSPLVVENLKTIFSKKHTFSIFGAVSLFLASGMLYSHMQQIIHDMLETEHRRNFFVTRLFFLLWLLGVLVISFAPLILEIVLGFLLSMGFAVPFFAQVISHAGLMIAGFFIFYLLIVSLHTRQIGAWRIFQGALYFALTMQIGKFVYQWLTGLNLYRYNIIYGSFASLMLVILWIFYFFHMFLIFVYWTTGGRERKL